MARGRLDLRGPRARLAGLALLLLGAGSIAWGAPGGLRPYRLPPNLLAYFKAKNVHFDAFSGRILNKICTAINVAYTPGSTLCD